MIQKKTTLIIGAGASNEVDLPLGSDLKIEIKKLLDFRFDFYKQTGGCLEIVEALRQLCYVTPDQNDALQEYIDAGRLISEGLPLAISIDNFIDAHKGNKKLEVVGKLAIAYAILQAERKSKLFIPQDNIYNKMNFESIEQTWYKLFFEIITENCQLEGLEDRLASLTLIIFNYDRCVEYFLIHALKQYYSLTYEEAYNLVSKINIRHPYGYLGSLPPQGGLTNSGGIQYGELPTAQLINSIYPGIKTFTESSDTYESAILDIREHIAHSQIVVFLGFAYHRLNLELLQPTFEYNPQRFPKAIYGTSLGISLSNEKLIVNDLVRLTNAKHDEVNLISGKCHVLFHEYGRGLSLS